jgi:hypothetical protein
MSLDKIPLDLLLGSNPRWWPTYWGMMIGGATSRTGNVARVYLSPIWIPRAMTVSRLSLNIITAGGSGTFFRFGLYEDRGATPVGGNVLEDSGDLDATVTGVKTLTFATPRKLARGWVWGFIETADAVIAFTASTVTNATLFSDVSSERLIGCYYDRGGGYGAPTNPCPAVTQSATGRAAMFLRVDSVND